MDASEALTAYRGWNVGKSECAHRAPRPGNQRHGLDPAPGQERVMDPADDPLDAAGAPFEG